MIQLDDVLDEDQNQDFLRVIDRCMRRGHRTLKRAFIVRDANRPRYEAMLQDAARDFWAAQRWGAIADGNFQAA